MTKHLTTIHDYKVEILIREDADYYWIVETMKRLDYMSDFMSWVCTAEQFKKLSNRETDPFFKAETPKIMGKPVRFIEYKT